LINQEKSRAEGASADAIKSASNALEYAKAARHDRDAATRAEQQKSQALEKLEKSDPDAAQLVKLRFFAGMSNAEAGQAMGISERTAKRYWTFARAWLFLELRGPAGR